jgi:hypothetical protein
LFAIAPVLLVATAIAGLAFNSDAVRAEIVNQLDHLVGREGAHAVQLAVAIVMVSRNLQRLAVAIEKTNGRTREYWGTLGRAFTESSSPTEAFLARRP